MPREESRDLYNHGYEGASRTHIGIRYEYAKAYIATRWANFFGQTFDLKIFAGIVWIIENK